MFVYKHECLLSSWLSILWFMLVSSVRDVYCMSVSPERGMSSLLLYLFLSFFRNMN